MHLHLARQLHRALHMKSCAKLRPRSSQPCSRLSFHMRGISGLFQNYNVGMLLLEGPRRRLKGSKETSTKLCVMKRLLSIAEATAHEITPGDYAKKKEVLQRQRGWAQGSRTASSGIWPPAATTPPCSAAPPPPALSARTGPFGSAATTPSRARSSSWRSSLLKFFVACSNRLRRAVRLRCSFDCSRSSAFKAFRVSLRRRSSWCSTCWSLCFGGIAQHLHATKSCNC
mmetsp:Transcript_29348/g.61295  ORF Transcript_29348/g.61295 Transcript_29348/m.61295 type:complete len:228 (+) Transcript_29348:122-805(+)